MGVFSRRIRDEIKLYNKLLNGLKFLESKSILLIQGKAAHKNWLMGSQKIICIAKNVGQLKVRQGKSNLTDYGFQLMVDHFDKPILRFDSDGATHYNSDDENLPLLQREIKTPHFHKFNKDGKEIAYRTDKLVDNEFAVQNNIQLGFTYFCDENYIQHHTGEPLMISLQQEMFPSYISNDIHKGIVFP